MENPVSGCVWVVDDQPGLLAVLRKTLERVGLTVHCFSRADDCLAALEVDGCDLLVTDVRMPGRDGIELLKEVRQRQPWVPVLVMTGFGDVPVAVDALKAGAADFIEKPLDRDAFLKLIRALIARNSAPNTPMDRSLTGMEAKILRQILEGRSNRKIADMLHRSPRTVEVHRRHLMRKMGAGNIVELLRRAAECRLLDSGAPVPGPAPRKLNRQKYSGVARVRPKATRARRDRA